MGTNPTEKEWNGNNKPNKVYPKHYKNISHDLGQF
jgi:hypothetical protein